MMKQSVPSEMKNQTLAI